MFTKPVIWPYNTGSQSAATLAESIRTKMVRLRGRYRPRRRHLIVNWGSTQLPNWWWRTAPQQVVNLPQQVELASNKLSTFTRLQQAGEDTVPFTTDPVEARRWLDAPIYGRKLNAVVCRRLTRANSGRGIVLARTAEEVVPAPLYTRYKPKTTEFRVHVWGGGVLDMQEKRKVNGFDDMEDRNPYIRNHNHGWVFCREELDVPDDVVEASISAVAQLGLDFGAVDLGWHPEFGVGIYEINTAPGIEGQTLSSYANKIRTMLYV